MSSWDIIGWLIIGFFVLVVGSGVAGSLVIFFQQLKRKNRWKKANAGKITCEATACTKIAEVRTRNGFYCREDARVTSRFSTFSFSVPLDYLSKEKK